VQLMPASGGFRGDLFVKPLGTIPPYCKPGIGNDTVLGNGPDGPVQGVRNKKLESGNLKKITSVLDDMVDMSEQGRFEIDSPPECLEMLDTLFELPFVKVEWPEGGRLHLRAQADFSQLSLSMKSKGSWFELMGELKTDEENALELAALLEQLHENPGSRFISLGNDEYLALSESLRKRLTAMQALIGPAKKGKLNISEFAAPLLNSWSDEGMKIKTDASYKKLIARIEKAAGQQYEVPTWLQASLRPYQEEGFRWMARLCEWGAGACLADDMGLGKTLQTIAMLLHRAPQGASVVIAPASVLLNWQQEIIRFAPSLTTKVLHGMGERDALMQGLEPYDVVLTTYGLLASETERLCGTKWNVIVLDEAHTIKNKETKMSKAAMELEGDFRLLLTGTPIQNHLGEIWNLFQFMNPGMLGTFDQFAAKFITPADSKEQRELLKALVSPFLLRRTKNEVLNDLPGKTEMVIPVELSPAERVVYETLRRKAEEKLLQENSGTVQTLAEITRLRQAASHIGMVGKNQAEESSKMKAFFELFEEMKDNNHRALVFSQFTTHLALFREALDKRKIPYLYLDGSTPVSERAKLVKSFQTGEQPLFLISLKAGGLGLNLTAADFIVHLDPWWNPALEDQASDRAYRIGQRRPVTVYRLIATDTIEEKIIELHHTKKDMADSLLEGTNNSHKLGREELLALLGL
ncbi:MAG: DEAD/DEAH box helicase, partial [Bacteroidales bacterium]